MTTIELNEYNTNRYNLKLSKNLAKLLLSVGIVVCVEKYTNGASGYRIYSDGFCEQWGNVKTSASQVTFLKTYRDTNYNAMATSSGTNEGGHYENIACNNRKVNSMKIEFVACGNSYKYAVNYHTWGYISYAL